MELSLLPRSEGWQFRSRAESLLIDKKNGSKSACLICCSKSSLNLLLIIIGK